MLGKIIKILKDIKFKAYLKKLEPFIKMGSSHLYPGFAMTLFKPVTGKVYLTIGEGSILNCKLLFESPEGGVCIGDNTFIGASTIIPRSNVDIGDNVFISWGCYLSDNDSHSLEYRNRELDMARTLEDYRNGRNLLHSKDWSVVNSKPIKICSNAWIGMHVIILKGVTVGEGAVVAAGSVVTKDIPPWSVVAGNPAKVVKTLNK